jgi:DNA gyrase subunit B
MKFKRIIVACDADDDGKHIVSLVVTFFYKHCRPLVDNGYLYIALPPLYGVNTGKSTKYIQDKSDWKNYLNNLVKKEYGDYAVDFYEDGINYYNDVNKLCDELLITPDLLTFCINCTRNGDSIKEKIVKEFPFCKIYEEESKKYIEGTINGTYQNLKLNNNFIGKCEDLANHKVFKHSVSIQKLVKANDNFDKNDIYHIIDSINNSIQPKNVTRFKGLGEMDSDELWETTINPKNRSLIAVTTENAEVIDDVMMKLMSDKAEFKREFLKTFHIGLDSLDI